MRTTVTLDDDVVRDLREAQRRSGRGFKEELNEALRRGLHAGEKPVRPRRRFRVRPRACGFQTGVDVARLNQLVDELELERAAPAAARSRRRR
jgi:hypothetical protein